MAHLDTAPTKAVDEVVKVNYKVHGCPINNKEFAYIVRCLLIDKIPVIPNYPVCVECKKNENECVFERGETCMGPVTWGGCDSVCVNQGYVCDGCRGALPHANVDAHVALMRERKIKDEDIRSRYRLFLGAEPIGRGV